MESASGSKTPLASSSGIHSRRSERRRRRPLSDCTNTVASPTPSSSSVSAPTPKPKAPPKSNPSAETARISSIDGDARTPTAGRVELASAHASSPPQSHDVTEPEEVEPWTVYTRRSAAEKRSLKGKAIAVSASASPVKGDRHLIEDMLGGERDGNVSKSCPLPTRKRQKSHPPVSGNVSHALEDYIKQQKSYFAEVDAFELLEEEVASGEESD